MNKQTDSKILRTTLTILWRVTLTVCIAAALCVVGVIMMLNTVFSGPSESAQDTLALTMLECELTQDIPGKFLSAERMAQINAGAAAEVGISDSSLIAIHTADPTSRTEMVQGKTYSATVTLYKDPQMCKIICEGTLLDMPLCNPCKVAGMTNDGILILADTAQALGSDVTHRFSCGPVLMINGHTNEALLAGSSGYAPYIAVGQRVDGTVIYVTASGWHADTPGATYRDLINIMAEYGAVNACILGINEE